jgi:DnaJ-class molecular chaperone
MRGFEFAERSYDAEQRRRIHAMTESDGECPRCEGEGRINQYVGDEGDEQDCPVCEGGTQWVCS